MHIALPIKPRWLIPNNGRNFKTSCLSAIPTMFLFDIGAHFGIFSLAAAHLGVKPSLSIPLRFYIMIVEQSYLNRLSDRIHVVEAAVSDQTGAVEMLSSESSRMAISKQPTESAKAN